MQWMAWAGALVVVLAMSFFIKLAYDEGWFGLIPAVGRCLLSAAFGAALVACGEVALRKVSRAAAVGLFSAGLGTLYLTAYATFRYFNLVSERGAFVLLAVVAMLGIVITIRGRLLTIGVLSLVGGYLGPVLLQPESQLPASTPLYAAMLLGVALVLSARHARPFRALRYVALVGHALIGSAWILDQGSQHWLLALSFMSVSWGAVVAEALIAARRGESTIGNVISALAATAWFVTLGCWVLDDVRPAQQDWLGLFTASIAGLAGIVAYLFGSGAGALRRAPRAPLDKFAVALWTQSGALLIVAIALQFDGFGQTIGWLALGLAAIELGRRLPSRGVSVFGLITGGLAILRVALIDYYEPELAPVVWASGNVTVTRWVLLALGTIGAIHLAARRIHPAVSKGDTLPIPLGILGAAGWLAVCALQCQGLAVTGGWLLGAVALLAAQRYGRRQRYVEIALAALVITASRWLIADAILARLATSESHARAMPFINWQMALALAIAGTGWWAFAVLMRRAREAAWANAGIATAAQSPYWQWALVATATFLLTALSFEVDLAVARLAEAGQTLGHAAGHLRHLLLTLLWTCGATGVAAVAAAVRSRNERGGARGAEWLLRFAWVALLGCAAKWVFWDSLVLGGFRSVDGAAQVWTVLNVQMVTGAVLAGAALLLARLSGATGRMAPASASDAWVRPARWVPVAAAVMLLWGLSFEVERAIAALEATRPVDFTRVWDPLHLRALWLTLLWAGGGLAVMTYGRLRPWRPMFTSGWCVLLGAVGVWLVGDTLGWRISHGVVLARPVLNLQCLSGAALAIMLGAGVWHTRRSRADAASANAFATAALACAAAALVALGLWLGSLEIDRIFAPETSRLADAAMARQTALSIYWGFYSIALVAAGFARRVPWMRYTGLGLLAVTLGKVLLVDLAQVEYLYRVLSLLGTGLLCIVTSVAYAKLSARLLGTTTGDES